MKILLLNPNSSELVTDTLRQAVEPLQTAMLHIDVKHCNNTPKGIVSCFDELKASVEVIDFLLEAEADYDGAIIGCFADPGLRAAREMIRIPVTGLYESRDAGIPSSPQEMKRIFPRGLEASGIWEIWSRWLLFDT